MPPIKFVIAAIEKIVKFVYGYELDRDWSTRKRSTIKKMIEIEEKDVSKNRRVRGTSGK